MEENVMRLFGDILNIIYVYTTEEVMDGSSNDGTLSATEDGVPIRKLFIGNLAQRTTHKDLYDVFSKYGKVNSCYLKRNTGRSNYAFVTFNNVADAMKARQDGSRKEIHLHNRDLRVMPADSWHQPDSIENQKKVTITKSSETSKEQLFQDYTADDAPIHRLNDDCLIHVFLYLPIADRVRIERVCKRWRMLSQESWRTVKSLDLSKSTWGFAANAEQQDVDTPTLRKVLLRCGRFLNHIDFSQISHRLRQSTLTIVGKLCPNLQTIDVTALNVSASGIDALTNNCQNITKFSLGSCTSSCDNDLQRLFAENKKLKYLRICQNNHITGKCLIQLCSDTIEEIFIEQCYAISPCHFTTAIAKFEKLTSLSLITCVGFNDSAIQAISSRADSLKSLKLCGYFPMITTSAMLHVAGLVNLEKLNVSLNLAVTDDFLIALAKQCRQLAFIDITGCIAITDKGMISIATLPKLENLIMSYLGKVTDEALGHLQNLRSLQCRGCPLLMDDGTSALIQLSPNLELLDLSGCDLITNNMLKVAVKATKIRNNSTILKVIVGGTAVVGSELTEISPFLQIVNVDLSDTYMRPDFDHNIFFPSEDDDTDSENDEIWNVPSIESNPDPNEANQDLWDNSWWGIDESDEGI